MERTFLSIIGVGFTAALTVWLLSFVVQALRRSPKEPASLRWAPEIAVRHVEIAGVRLRYVKTGVGPTLVLLHTLRTQLDLFEKIIPSLSQHFTVYALDYPGHGYSDIPRARYDAPFFANAIEGFLDQLDLRDVTLAGISIGGVIPLMIASRHNARVTRVVSVNPYDYADGRGMARSSFFGWFAGNAALIPVVGEIMMRLTPFFIMRRILNGGVADARNLSRNLAWEMYRVGARPRHYRAFLSLLRNAKSWQVAQTGYGSITLPVLLVWGDKDWSQLKEREHTQALIPGVTSKTVRGAGHFLALDRPEELSALILEFTKRSAS